MLTFSLVIFFIGCALLALGGFSFRWRAVTNKPAWEGMTKPFLFIGLIVFIISLVLLFFTYPR